MESGISGVQTVRGAMAGLAMLLGVGCPVSDEPGPPVDDPPGCLEGQIDDEGVCVPQECGLGPWGWLDVDDPELIVHVSVDGSSDGDGSRAAPLDSVLAGFDLAVADGAPLVALGAGEWEESLVLVGGDLPVELRGRCSALVEVRGADDVPAVEIPRGDVTLSGFTISGGAHGIDIDPPSGGDRPLVTFRDLRITDSETVGLMVFDAGTVVTLERVLVDGIRDDGSGVFGIGIDLERGAEARVTDLRIEQTEGVGLFLSDEGTLLTGEGIVLEEASGVALQVQLGAVAEVDDLHVSDFQPCSYVQRCADVLPPLVDGEDAAEPWCQAVARETASLLEYAIYVSETGMEE